MPYSAFSLFLQSSCVDYGSYCFRRLKQVLEIMEWPKPFPKQQGGEIALNRFSNQLQRRLPQMTSAMGLRTATLALTKQAAWELKFSALHAVLSDLILLDQTSSTDNTMGPQLTMKTLTDPMVVRFRFHFEGNRPTNRFDKVRCCYSIILQRSTFGSLNGTFHICSARFGIIRVLFITWFNRS